MGISGPLTSRPWDVSALGGQLADGAVMTGERPHLPPDSLAHAVAPEAIAELIVYLVSDAAGRSASRSCPPTEPAPLHTWTGLPRTAPRSRAPPG